MDLAHTRTVLAVLGVDIDYIAPQLSQLPHASIYKDRRTLSARLSATPYTNASSAIHPVDDLSKDNVSQENAISKESSVANSSVVNKGGAANIVSIDNIAHDGQAMHNDIKGDGNSSNITSSNNSTTAHDIETNHLYKSNMATEHTPNAFAKFDLSENQQLIGDKDFAPIQVNLHYIVLDKYTLVVDVHAHDFDNAVWARLVRKFGNEQSLVLDGAMIAHARFFAHIHTNALLWLCQVPTLLRFGETGAWEQPFDIQWLRYPTSLAILGSDSAQAHQFMRFLDI